MHSTPTIEQELRSVYLLAGLNSVQFDNVIQTSRIIELEEGEKLFDQGDSAKQFFLVRRGQIKLFRITQEGQEKIIEIVMPGQTFAEAIMFMERPSYPVSATALHPTELIAFDSASYVDILRNSVDACFRLMADMSLWLHSRLNEIEALSAQNATLRLTNYLLQDVPRGAQGSTDIVLDLPKYVLASRLSIAPESLSRIFHGLQQSELITVEGQTIHIHDIEGLRSYGITHGHGKTRRL
jgi:CRP-like cAMP-binding protein